MSDNSVSDDNTFHQKESNQYLHPLAGKKGNTEKRMSLVSMKRNMGVTYGKHKKLTPWKNRGMGGYGLDQRGKHSSGKQRIAIGNSAAVEQKKQKKRGFFGFLVGLVCNDMRVC